MRTGPEILLEVEKIKLKEADLPPFWPPESGSFQELKVAIMKKGLLNPVILDQQNQVLEGHYRFQAARETNMKLIPVVYDGRKT